MRLRCRGHLQVFIEHPLHCGVGVGRDRGRQPSRGVPYSQGPLPPSSALWNISWTPPPLFSKFSSPPHEVFSE